MFKVLMLQMLPAAALSGNCESDVSCHSNASCESNQSCASWTSRVQTQEF